MPNKLIRFESVEGTEAPTYKAKVGDAEIANIEALYRGWRVTFADAKVEVAKTRSAAMQVCRDRVAALMAEWVGANA